MQTIDSFFTSLSQVNFKIYTDYLLQQITIEFFIKILILYFFIVWISIIVWVYKDITNRTLNSFYQIISLLLVLLFTPLGIFIYLLIRPIKTLTEKYYEEIEENLDILSETIAHTIVSCPGCQKDINSHYSNCPHCQFSLYEPCGKCSKPVFFDWNSCPHCGKKNKRKVEEDKKTEKQELPHSHSKQKQTSKKD
jgi:hypothetical protein